MLMFDPLFETRERARRLRAEAAAERLGPPPPDVCSPRRKPPTRMALTPPATRTPHRTG